MAIGGGGGDACGHVEGDNGEEEALGHCLVLLRDAVAIDAPELRAGGFSVLDGEEAAHLVEAVSVPVVVEGIGAELAFLVDVAVVLGID